MFNQLGHNVGEDLCVHLDARRTLASSKKSDVPAFSPVYDEIHELRKTLDKLAAKSSEAAPSSTSSPFNLEIQQAYFPTRFRMPTMTSYEEKTDPQDHLDAFKDHMDLLQVSSHARCRYFVVTLSATTKKWFRQIEPEAITSWTQLSELFMRQFQRARKYTTPLSRLASIKQGPNEKLKTYFKRFNEELATIQNPQENGVLMAAISGVQPEMPFWDKLQKDECKILQEFYRRADKIMRLEIAREAIHAKKSTFFETTREGAQARKPAPAEKSEESKKRKNGDRRRSPQTNKQEDQKPRSEGPKTYKQTNIFIKKLF